MGDPHSGETADETPEARFGAELRRLRERAGLSGRQLAEELHRSQSSIVDYERGRRLPSVEVVEQYEDFFGLSRGTLGAQRERARVERLEWPKDATVDEDLGHVVCPYKGLRAFEYEDAALFFGRESQVERVLARLAEVRFVVVVGASGSGKSSFVRAGLLARIRATRANGAATARVIVLTPGEHPVDEIAAAVSAATDDKRAVLAEDLRADPDHLRRVIGEADGGGSVIVVDQFEELFTLCHDEAERRCFVDALIAAWRDPASPVSVIVALRADFYGRVAPYPELAAAVVAHQTLIGPMNEADLRRVIELPAAQTGLLLQPGLVETILEDLGDEPGALPLLSHALLETWERRRRLMLTVSGYREAGGVRGAIAQTAERTLQSLPEPDQAIARQVFLRLTDVGEGSEPTRRRVDRAEVAAHSEASQSLDRVFGILADARLVTIDERTVMVAHEALIRHWPRLRGWIDSDREGLLIHRRLTDAAREWHTLNSDPAALYRGARLAATREWATDHDDELSRLERDFLTASQASEHREAEAAKRRTRRIRVLATGLAALTVMVGGLAVWALDERNDARRQATKATSLALASSALSLLNSRPDVGLLLALEGYRTSPRAEARSSVLAALTAVRRPGTLAILHGHTDGVMSVEFSPDRRTLASASDETIQLWNVGTHRLIGAPLKGHTDAVVSVAFSPDGRTLASASFDNTIRLWDVRTCKQQGRPLTGHTGEGVYGVAFSLDGRMLASAGADGTLRLWDMRTHKQIRRPLRGHTSLVNSVAFSHDGHMLASASSDETVRVWNVRTHKQIGAPLRAHTDLIGGRPNLITDVAFGPNRHTLASGDSYGTVRLWDVRRHKQLGRPLRGHKGNVQSVAFSPNGHTLASASLDRTAQLWDVRTHKKIGPPLTGHTHYLNSVAFSPDGHTLATGSDDRTIRLWAARKRTRSDAPLSPHTGTIRSVAFDRDGRALVSANGDDTVRFWDVRTHRQRGRPLTGHTKAATDLAFSPDWRTLASASADRTLRLWDVRTHNQIGRPLKGHTDAVVSVAFSPNGHTLASASSDDTIRFWDLRTHKQIGRPVTGRAGDFFGVAFSPNGHTLASTGFDGKVRLWNVRTHKQIGEPLTGHTARVESVAFSPDGHTLASVDFRTVRLWDVHTHQQIGEPLTDPTTVGAVDVAFTPDGQTLAAAGNDGTVRLWDVRTHKQIGALTGHKSNVTTVAFSPDGRTLASASYDKTIRLWTGLLWHNITELQNHVCRLVGSGLRRTEWAQYAGGIPYRQSCP